jgi:cytochrome b6-f complex iron-sulfur subunit
VNAGTVALILVAVGVVAWALFMVNVTVRRQRKAASSREHPTAGEESRSATVSENAPDAAGGSATGGEVTVKKVPEEKLKPLTPDQLAVSRRQFLNRAWTASFSAFLGFFGMATLSFLWPKLTGGFGTRITVGDYEELLRMVGPEGDFKPLFVAEGRFWLTYYDGDPGDIPVYLAVGAGETKMQALYRKCVHLGCSVPHCSTSMLFECPCHGSKYRLNGEFYGGPAPRGLDRFPISIEGGKVVVDTGDVQEGPPRGINTWDQFAEPQGPLCVPT